MNIKLKKICLPLLIFAIPFCILFLSFYINTFIDYEDWYSSPFIISSTFVTGLSLFASTMFIVNLLMTGKIKG